MQDSLAANITQEQGKTLADAKGDVFRGLGGFADHATSNNQALIPWQSALCSSSVLFSTLQVLVIRARDHVEAECTVTVNVSQRLAVRLRCKAMSSSCCGIYVVTNVNMICAYVRHHLRTKLLLGAKLHE